MGGKDQPLGNTSIELAEVMRVGNISSRPQKLSNCNSGEIISSPNVVESVESKKTVDDNAIEKAKKSEQAVKPKTPVEDVEKKTVEESKLKEPTTLKETMAIRTSGEEILPTDLPHGQIVFVLHGA